jgi:hypothetical protein
MKTPLLLFILWVASSLHVCAELIVYRESERARVIGSGVDVTVPVTTWVVYNNSTQSFDVIGAFRAGTNKYYAISNSTYRVTQNVAGPRGSYTVISRTVDSNDDPNVISSSYFAKGSESNLQLGNGATMMFPRLLKAVTRAVIYSNGQLATYESSSTLFFQARETKRANEGGDTASAVIERIRQRLEAQGYTPVP